MRALLLSLALCSGVAAEEWTVVPQRRPPLTPPRMCWVTHREPDRWVTTPGRWVEERECRWGPWHWEGGFEVRYLECGDWQWVWEPGTRKLIPGRTYKRLEPCPKRHILTGDEIAETEASNGVVNPDDHPVERRNRSVLESRRTRTTPTCD